jgi:hypothetical protein
MRTFNIPSDNPCALGRFFIVGRFHLVAGLGAFVESGPNPRTDEIGAPCLSSALSAGAA